MSDTHRYFPEIKEEGDILIHSGDYSLISKFYKSDLKSLMEEFIPFRNYLFKLKSQFKHIIYVPGNHDWLFESFPNIHEEIFENKVICLNNKYQEIENIKFFGCPYTPEFCGWAFMMEEPELADMYKSLPEKVDIFIGHGPVYGILDQAYPGTSHLGSKALLTAISKLRPKYFICGHIHGGYGISKSGPTTFINASICNEDYKPLNPPIAFNFHPFNE